MPVIVVGDLNSAADGSTTPTYARFVAPVTAGGAGMDDAWSIARPGAPGLSSSQAEDLRNFPSQLYQRIDYLLVRAGDAFELRVRSAETTGDTPAAFERIGLWPSDHAGVVATLRLKHQDAADQEIIAVR